MTPEELHRAVITAVAFGGREREAKLRRRFTGLDERGAVDYLWATVAVCLSDRFGGFDVPIFPPELAAFMSELRAARSPGAPWNFLEVEAVVRGIFAEPHLLEEIGTRQQAEALRFILRYLTDTNPEIREDFDTVIDRAQELMKHQLLS